MRTLLALVALVVVLATAVWFKTTPAELPPTQAPQDKNLGIATFGVNGTEAGFTDTSTTPPAVEASSESTIADTVVEEQEPQPEIVVHEPQMPEVPDPQPTEITYTVMEGDSMYRIIKRSYGTYSEDILQKVSIANNLQDPSAIGIGDVIILPVIAGVKPPSKL